MISTDATQASTASISPRNRVNNSWVSKTDSKSVVIFMHGVLSSAQACWLNSNGTYWPDLVVEDPIFQGCSVFLAGYETSVSSGIYNIDQCARAVISELRIPFDGTKTPLDREVIVFVCHSLGGVVARRMIEQYRESFRDKHVGIVLLASPSLGSQYAKSLARIAKLYGHKIGRELIPQSDAILDIDNRFRDVVRRNDFASFSGAEACEHYGPLRFSWLPLRSPAVVETTSASRYFGGVTVIPDTDHFSIAKPSGVEHPSHKFLVGYFYDYISKSFSALKDKPTEIPSGESDPLFDVYSHRHRDAYLVRSADHALDRNLKLNSVWVHGLSGTGKTSLAKRWMLENSIAPVEITLAHLQSNDTRVQVIEEIRQSIQERGEALQSAGLRGIVDSVGKLAESCIVPLFLDEVPLSSNLLHSEITAILGALLDSVKRRSHQDTRFLICSILKPNIGSFSEKMREQIVLFHLERWTEIELMQLVDLISLQLPRLDLDGGFKHRVVEKANGSPRFVKTFFRRYVSSGVQTRDAREKALHEACDTFGMGYTA